MTYKYKILSMDGGGIRGIIPALILTEIERCTGKPICQLFDLIAGTSTGGILALGLTKPSPLNSEKPEFSAAELADLYRNRGAEIFYEPPIERWTSVDDIVRPKYPSIGRETVLANQFESAPLSSALTEVLLTSYEIEYRAPVFFTNQCEKEKAEGRTFRRLCHDVSMKQAAMATSAAPTYFEPYVIRTEHNFEDSPMPALKGKTDYVLIDGGVIANNPTALAIIEARKSYEQQTGTALSLDEILVVSLGTGSLTRVYNYEKAKNWGLVGWIQPIVNIALDGTSEIVAVQLEQLLNTEHYYRMQGYLDLEKGNDEMDKATPENIAELENLTEEILKQERESGRFAQLCQKLLESSEKA